LKIQYLNFIFLTLISISCVDRFNIPEDINSGSGTIGAGDTSYLQLNPVWNQANGLSQPVEISIAQDGRIFVADIGNNSILVFDQNGNTPSGFEALKDLKNSDNFSIKPIDVDIDKKMNVFFIDGSQKIYVWNQYWNLVGINRVSTGGTFTHIESGVDTVETVGTDLWMALLNDSEWKLTSIDFLDNQDLIDSLLSPHEFYNGKDEKNLYLDPHYDSDSSKFTGLTSPSDNENMIFVTDNYGGINNQYRIVQINFQKSMLLELATGDTVWAYTGEFGSTVKGYGTGAGTVNQPLSLDVDYQGNLYYTQVGNYFPIHMIIPNLSGDFATYSSGFQPEADDIMDANYFVNPFDVAVDKDKNVYVVDSSNSDVTVFHSNGDYFKKAGYNSSEDTLSFMNEPVAVTVDQRGVVYVCDKGDGSIYRFKLSNTLDEDINPEN
jgi:hypothetical protein